MQTDYAPECLHTDVPSKEALLAAAQDGSILQATAARCDVQHNLILPLDGMTGIMPREECALGIDTGTTREIAILSRVGKPVSFQVLCIRGDVAYVSRRRAQQRAFEQLLHKRPGDILPVRVTHLEPFGAFVDAGCGLVSLIGIENLSVSRIFHPSDRVQVGQQLYAVLSGIDADTGRISLTHRELLGTWAENAAQFAAGETVCGIVRSVEDYGVFIELAPNLSGLAELRFPVAAGDLVSCYIKSILPERMKIKLNLIDRIGTAPVPPPRCRILSQAGTSRAGSTRRRAVRRGTSARNLTNRPSRICNTNRVLPLFGNTLFSFSDFFSYIPRLSNRGKLRYNILQIVLILRTHCFFIIMHIYKHVNIYMFYFTNILWYNTGTLPKGTIRWEHYATQFSVCSTAKP